MGKATDRIVELVNRFTPDGDFVISDQAEKLRAHLQEQEPNTLEAFLNEQLDFFLRTRFRDVLNARRRHMRQRAKARAFSDAVKDWGENPEDELIFEVTYTIDKDNTRRRLGDMTGKDHSFVADRYDGQASHLKLLASFHRVVARKVGDAKTSDVFDPEEFLALQESIFRGNGSTKSPKEDA